ncbi:hypothetical protein, partial [Nostoc sp. 'Peltigera malacea cyanobiont' DB3992]|uniref:hypothetical protein n=1 Tax=Nostoc sp. 'Peltigera malacea cyanobiont' DB3992 TaxID=1206980 RepID=UPI00211ECC45
KIFSAFSVVNATDDILSGGNWRSLSLLILACIEAMPTVVTKPVVPLRGSKLRAASRREVR